jgi:hypothetical protein
MFAREAMQTLYSFRLLDDLIDAPYRLVPSDLFLSYLAYRVANEPAKGNALLRCMRRVMNVIQGERNIGEQEPVAMQARLRDLLQPVRKGRLYEILHWKDEVCEAEYERYLFAAGICVNNFDIVRQCLTRNPELFSELNDCRSDNLIYGPYSSLVARYGGPEIMSMMMTYGTTTVNRGLRTTFFEEAARAGRADIVRYVHDFKRDEVPWNFTSNSCVLYNAQNTASPEVLKFVAELRSLSRKASSDGEYTGYSLHMCIEMGRLDTVKHAMQLGADPRGTSSMGNPRDNFPVRVACRRGYIPIVEYLLEFGADPKQAIASASEWGRTELVERLLGIGIPPTGALSKAAAGGYISVVRLLLDAGVEPNETGRLPGPISPLAGAIAKEHPAVFALLIERGADLHAYGVAEECVQRARKDGLDSMLLLLEAHGVDIAKTTCDEDNHRDGVE